MEDHFSADIV
jgi:hypothetical protein